MRLTLVIVICLVVFLPLGLAVADAVPSEVWQAMQDCWLVKQSVSWDSPDISPLLASEAQLVAWIAEYGPDIVVRCWEPGVEVLPQYAALDLRDEAVVRAYFAETTDLPYDEFLTLPYIGENTLSELLAEARAVLGVRNDDLDDLTFVIAWGEAYAATPMPTQPDGGIVGSGMPGFYYVCREHLLQLQATSKVHVAPIALLGQRPMRVAQTDGQLFIPISSLGIPQRRVKWDADTKTATLDLARRVTIASSRSVAEVDGASVSLSAPPRIEDGRLMISVRDVKPLFGLDYKWDPKLWAVRIFSPET